MNPRLRLAIQNARAENMPKDNIERAIKKALGGDADTYEQVRYEGYAPGGVAVIVEALTDNRNRTVAEVRHAFGKCGGNLGTSGSVAFQFSEQGVLSYPAGSDEDRIMEVALEAGAEDVESGTETHEVVTSPDDLATVRDALDGVAMMPFGAFEHHIKASAADTVVLRYGGADALRGTPLAAFERDLGALAALARVTGKRVLLVGVIETASHDTDAYDLAVERTADALGLGFVDVRSVPFALPDDLADGVHPAQAWSDRITAAIVRHLNSPQP
jgi:YebC/PmpR family DNA-binding regulatory protein